jgi:hypothetical protein
MCEKRQIIKKKKITFHFPIKKNLKCLSQININEQTSLSLNLLINTTK